MTITEHLRAARAFVERGWCQNAFARQENGDPAVPRSKKACQWCVMGALIAAMPGKPPAGLMVSCDALFRKAARTSLSIHKWQDKKGRKKEQVLRVFDKAIILAETQS